MRPSALALLASAASIVLAPSCTKSHANGPAPGVDAGPPPPNVDYGDVPVTGTVHLAHMSGPVDMVRDAHGMVHVFATTAADALRVEGYQVARDRTAQLELIRRTAEGRMAEVFGQLSPSLIDEDIAMRMIGLGRVAQAMYDALDPSGEEKAWIDAYADGISQFNARVQSGDESFPTAMALFPPTAFAPWTGVDVLAVARLQAQNLAYTATNDVADTAFVQAARAAFSASSTDPLVQKRAGLLVDLVRFAPMDPTTVLTGFPNDATDTHAPVRSPAAPVRAARPVDPAVLGAASAWAAAAKRVHDAFGHERIGSNDWMISPSRSATGHAMVASDPHLALSAPANFWMVHVDVTAKDPAQDVEFAGVSFPGLFGMILGFNDHVAWGATTAFYDVTDVYQETLTPDGGSVTFNGANVALQKVHEEIPVQGGPPVAYDVLVVPHHGPIIPTIVNHQVVAPDPAKGALSVKWTGLQPTKDASTVTGSAHAKNVDDARAAVENFAVGAQNWVFADTNGDTFYSSHAVIPTRDKRAFTWDPKTFTGTLPCFVLPGDGTAEWTGALDKAYVPHVKNPAKGYLATANNDQVGITLGNDPSSGVLPNGQPIFLTAFYDPGGALRAGRITHDIESAPGKLGLTDLAAIQADVHSNLGERLAPKLLASIANAEAERATPGSHPDLTALVADPRYAAAGVPALASLLTQWGKDDYDTPAGVSLDDGSPSSDAKETADSEATLVFNAWLPNMFHRTFDDELAKITQPLPADFDLRQALVYLMTAPDPTTLATYDAATKDSALFDDATTPAVETRDAQTIAALLDGIDLVTKLLGSDPNGWRWGKVHTLTFASLVSRWGSLSIPPAGDAKFPNGFPRHGEDWVIDVGGVSAYDTDPKSAAYTFSYDDGPNQRFVIDMDPVAGPTAFNALPGGAVWDNTSPHFRDEAELWRRNQNHAIPMTHDAIVQGADEHVVYGP